MSVRKTVPCALVALALAACGSSPNPTFYALSPAPGAAQPASLRVVKVRRLSIPGYLDRPEIVRRVVDHRLGVAEYERWGEPLGDMVGRVIAEDLEERLQGASVYMEGGAISAEPDAVVEIELRRFDVGPQGDVTLSAEIAVERATPNTPPVARAITLKATPPNGSTQALVGTMSTLLGQLTDRITPMLAR